MITTTITSLGQRGEGVTEIDGTRVFVPFTLPGERIEIDAEAERGHMVGLLEKSPDRVEPICPYFGTCGGCALQHAGPETYANFKRGLVETALSHVGITVPVGELINAEGPGRRRTTLHTRKHGAGYARARTHDILAIEACPILVPSLQKAAPRIAHLLHGLAGDCDVA
ncbi:MAG: RNA methyltransferase, partial [Hyphomicrobiales bacterium]